MVRSHLDYCSSVWTPYKICDIKALEKIQKRVTEIVPQRKQKSSMDQFNAKYEDCRHIFM